MIGFKFFRKTGYPCFQLPFSPFFEESMAEIVPNCLPFYGAADEIWELEICYEDQGVFPPIRNKFMIGLSMFFQ